MEAGSQNEECVQLSVSTPVFAETYAVLREVVDDIYRLVGEELHEVIMVISPAAPAETVEACARLEAQHDRLRVTEQRRSPGLGWAVRQGMGECTGSHILLIDSDGEMDVETVPLMLQALKRDKLDLVVASRWMEGGGIEGYDTLKYYLNIVFQRLFGWLFRTPITDLTLGYKLGSRDVLQGFTWRGTFHEIGCETTLRPIRAGYRVGQVPTVWRRRKEGKSNNSFWVNLRYVGMALTILVAGGSAQRQPKEAT